MNDIRATIERIKSADAVPSPDSFPTGALSSSELLARIDERSTEVTNVQTIRRSTEPTKPPGRGRGPLIAFAVAAVLVLIFGVTAFNVLSGDDVGPADPTPTTPTTIEETVEQTGPRVIDGPRAEGALPPGTPLLEVVDTFRTRFDSGDVAGYEALFHPDNGYPSGQDAPSSWFNQVTGSTTEHECTLVEPTQVRCTEQAVSGLEPGTVSDPYTTVWNGDDGFIWTIEFPDGPPPAFADPSTAPGVAAYRDWMQTRLPDAFADLFPDGTAMKLDTPTAREDHQRLIAMYFVSTGPREAPALPIDTPLMEVVSIFQARSDAGDVEGYEAIIHPSIGYPPGANAYSTWFSDVTGTTVERDCVQVGPTQVRCTETAHPGLQPGTVLDPITVMYWGADGYLWAVDIPSGALVNQGNVAIAAGVKEYRDWLKANDPAAFDELFPDGLAMALSTEELRARHRELIATYLAATG